MSASRLSVVVVSWGRPRALARCLTALSQLRSTRFEVIVVADPDGLAVARAQTFAARLTLLDQQVENISIARNTGIAAAAGEIVAFMDDDAVPEPDWAETILQAFDQPGLDAATGPVIGRNGISLQWGRMACDRMGRDRWLSGDAGPHPSEVLKLHGTNMAFRREVLALHGGFDPSYRFYLDETDLALRLAAAGAVLRYLSGMRVHHGFAESRRRRGDRVPTDLTDIGSSTAVFLRKHAPDALEDGLTTLIADQRARLLRLARGRRIGPAEIRRLLEGLQAGIDAGRACDLGQPGVLPIPDRPFHPLRTDVPPPMSRRDGWRHAAASLRAAAAADVARGQPAALILLEPSPRKHRVVFTDGGWWEQTGGLYGPAARSEARLQFWRYRDRISREWGRLFGVDGRNCSQGGHPPSQWS